MKMLKKLLLVFGILGLGVVVFILSAVLLFNLCYASFISLFTLVIIFMLISKRGKYQRKVQKYIGGVINNP